MEWNQFWALFHHAWGQAKESLVYDKSKFSDMQYMLQDMEHKMKKGLLIQDRRKRERRKVGVV